jgi:hypothetical protein
MRFFRLGCLRPILIQSLLKSLPRFFFNLCIYGSFYWWRVYLVSSLIFVFTAAFMLKSLPRLFLYLRIYRSFIKSLPRLFVNLSTYGSFCRRIYLSFFLFLTNSLRGSQDTLPYLNSKLQAFMFNTFQVFLPDLFRIAMAGTAPPSAHTLVWPFPPLQQLSKYSRAKYFIKKLQPNC